MTAALSDLSSDYPLAKEDIESFQQNGHVLLRHVCSPEEVAAYRPVLNDAVETCKTETRKLEDRDTYGKAFLQVTNLWQQDEGVRKFTLARRFARIAADLMGVDGVRLWHDQALYKEARGGKTPWHQDQYYWPLDTTNTVTLWMPLVDVPIEKGALTFASKSHKDGPDRAVAISDQSEEYFDALVKERGYAIAQGEMQAGDATFHAGWTLHHAPGNDTDTTREVMTIIYFADDTRINEPTNPNQINDLKTWLPGLAPGDLAASELNPLVYSRQS